MAAAQKFQQSRLKRLDADADCVCPRVAIAEKFVAVHVARIGFQRDRAVRVDRKRRRHPSQELADALGLEGRGRAAAEKNALRRAPAPFVGIPVMFQLPQQRVRVALLRDGGDHMRVEVAVRALADAVGNMNVEGEWVLRHKRSDLSYARPITAASKPSAIAQRRSPCGKLKRACSVRRRPFIKKTTRGYGLRSVSSSASL